MHELCGRQLMIVGADGPLAVVEVENGEHRDEVHGGLEVAADAANIAPVAPLSLLLTRHMVLREVVGKDGPALAQH